MVYIFTVGPDSGGLGNQVLPAFCVSVSDPYKPSLEKLAAEGVITYDDNVKVADVSRSTWLWDVCNVLGIPGGLEVAFT